MVEASRKSALAISNPKETVQTESYEGPIRIALEEVEAKKLPETAEGKKKVNSKGKRADEDEEARPKKEKKEKKEKKSSEKMECRREEKCLKKEEKRKRASSPDVDGESTITRVEEGVSTQERESAQPQEASTHIRTVATKD
ncbi:probable H/ACA ribonucleoprotein complex subunit 4 [Benincasa hispida]|uniref:probable H/ACA ribonucleoprotein complex subunit 4 n=1 Tax=Benincasa hispida TaxID=102211 RepID=UPI00190015A7|nr:probable H/ACA ribonucleoprotein complex subunit 4 [Benincasa hispida]